MTESQVENYPDFKARPIKKDIFTKVDALPEVEKREKTTFEEFQLSNPTSDLRKRTYVEYQKELEAMEKAKFKARNFDKQKFEKKRL